MQNLIDQNLLGIRTSFRKLIMTAHMQTNPIVYGVASAALERAISWIINLGTWINRTLKLPISLRGCQRQRLGHWCHSLTKPWTRVGAW